MCLHRVLWMNDGAAPSNRRHDVKARVTPLVKFCRKQGRRPFESRLQHRRLVYDGDVLHFIGSRIHRQDYNILACKEHSHLVPIISQHCQRLEIGLYGQIYQHIQTLLMIRSSGYRHIFFLSLFDSLVGL